MPIGGAPLLLLLLPLELVLPLPEVDPLLLPPELPELEPIGGGGGILQSIVVQTSCAGCGISPGTAGFITQESVPVDRSGSVVCGLPLASSVMRHVAPALPQSAEQSHSTEQPWQLVKWHAHSAPAGGAGVEQEPPKLPDPESTGAPESSGPRVPPASSPPGPVG
jgi:hypothetical protein